MYRITILENGKFGHRGQKANSMQNNKWLSIEGLADVVYARD